jgi:superfamily II DNA or RNA helicase
MYKLRDYQVESLEIIKNMSAGERKLIKIPTGGGKTVIFASLSSQVKGRVLIVVPSKELREQAFEKIKAIDETINIGNVQAKLDEVDSKIVIASRQSLTHKKSTRMQRMLKHGDFEYIIFDEVHQAVDQVEKIINKINKTAKIIGFTATPYNKELNKIFDKIHFERDIFNMILNGYLCEPKAIMVQSKTNLNHVKVVAGEFNLKELEEAVNNGDRNELIVKAYIEYAKHRKSTIVFASGISHCNSIKEEFKRNGIKCESIDSTMSKDERESVIESFTSGKIPVLVNVAVLTTGFDHPETDCIILARPTKSRILYEQIIGRGLRIADNKEDCLIIDINDVVKNHDLMSLSDVFNMKIKHGETPKEAQKRIKREKEEEEERLRQEEIRRQEELKRKQKEIELRAKQIKLFNRDFQNRILEAKYDWFKIDGLTYALSYATDKHFIIERIDENEITKYNLYESNTNKENKSLNFIKQQENLKDLIQYVENVLIKKVNSFVSKNGDWKIQVATENQRKYVPYAKTKWDCHIYFTSYNIKTLLKNRGA